MKLNIIKSIRVHIALGLSLMIGLSSCTFDEQTDPNNPSVVGILDNATVSQLNNLVVGLESTTRNSLGVQTTASGIMAREFYLFDADPRNTTNLLGKEGSALENGDFYVTAAWAGRYRAIKNANLLIQAVNTTNVDISAENRAGYVGFAQTLIAYELIEVLKSYGKARIDVIDPDNLGPILEFNDALAEARNLLDMALTNLNQAGNSFLFPLAGFSGFNTPSTFSQFNRAVAAVAALYDGDNVACLAALSNSYFDIAGDLSTGPKHIFSQSSGDQTNPLFKIASTSARPNNGDQIIVHNSFITEAEPGDTRVTSKTAVRPEPTSQDDLNGTHETRLYSSIVDPIDMLRNEELILVYAEANIGTNLGQAVAGLNKIRTEAGLLAYTGATDDASLVTELLKQRRYSLWCENHRLFDLRRYNLNSTLPIDRAGDQIFDVLPIPFTETN